MFFSDEIFTIAPPVNLQNDRVYAPRGIRNLRMRPTFSKSVAISKLGCTELIFVEPGVKVLP